MQLFDKYLFICYFKVYKGGAPLDKFSEDKMAISRELLDILCCPVCKGDIFYDEENQKLNCLSCKRRYPIKDDIPIMLEEEAEI